MSGSQNPPDEAALDLDNLMGSSDQEHPQSVIQEQPEHLLSSEGADEQHLIDFCNERRALWIVFEEFDLQVGV